MQDAKKIQKQVDEMVVRADVKAAVTQNHRQILTERKAETERELTKMKLILEMFGISQKLLDQRTEQFKQAEQQPPAVVFEGLAAAKIEFVRLEQQAREAVMRHDGAFAALNAMDETFRQEEMQATSRVRGLPQQGKKLVQMAESASGEIQAPQEAPEAPAAPAGQQEVPGFLDSMGGVEEAQEAQEAPEPEKGDSAKEPMGAPQQKATKKRSRRKA